VRRKLPNCEHTRKSLPFVEDVCDTQRRNKQDSSVALARLAAVSRIAAQTSINVMSCLSDLPTRGRVPAQPNLGKVV
jgi:hypothetical protein